MFLCSLSITNLFLFNMQAESLNLQDNEFALSKDLMVSLWSQYRTFSGKEPLKDIYDGNFVIIDDILYEDFKSFKKEGESFQYCAVEALDILKYWSRSIMKDMKAVHIIGKTFFLMSPVELDDLCNWVCDARKQKSTLPGMPAVFCIHVN